MPTTTKLLQGEISSSGAFARQPVSFDGRLSSDGSTGYPAAPDRYHLYVSLACPWAHRSIIVRRLLGLEQTIGMTVVNPIRDDRGWAFGDGPGHSSDPINGFTFLSQAYLASDPGYVGRYTVPALWDKQNRKIVSNNYRNLCAQLASEFTAYVKTPLQLYPEPLRAQIDALDQDIYAKVNNGVYRAGFAVSQQAYEVAFDALFDALDRLEELLTRQRYLVGNELTLADIRLYTTLVRFDVVYHFHFKCNLRRLTDYGALWAYARDLFQRPGFHDTTDFDHIKRHYYTTHPHINPTGIVPKGPQLDWWSPHQREAAFRRSP